MLVKVKKMSNEELIKQFIEEMGWNRKIDIPVFAKLNVITLMDRAKQEVFDDDIIKHQFACLEFWCASRHDDKGDYCGNCKKLNKLKEKQLSGGLSPLRDT